MGINWISHVQVGWDSTVLQFPCFFSDAAVWDAHILWSNQVESLFTQFDFT